MAHRHQYTLLRIAPPTLFLWLLTACVTRSADYPTRVQPAEAMAVTRVSTEEKPQLATIPPTYTTSPQQLSEETAALSQGATANPSPSLMAATPSSTAQLPTRTPRPTPTGTPTGTPTRYIRITPDLPPSGELGPSKLGLHVIRNNDPAIMAFVRRAQPAVLKVVDDFGFLMEVKAESPRTISVGRITIDNQDMVGNPEQAARKFVARYLQIYQLNPAVDYWEAWNEPDPNLDHMVWYTRFEQERVRQMANYGFRTAVGGFAAGVPELDEFALFLPAIETVKEHGGILTLHEYSAPDITYLYGSPLPGYPAHPDRGSLAFRYRWFYGELLEPANLVVPLVISEAGIDGIIGNRPGPSGLGWWDFQTYWVQQGWGIDGPDSFINQLAWYDAGVRQDGYVIGFAIFTAGGYDYWENYNINKLLPQLADYVVSER